MAANIDPRVIRMDPRMDPHNVTPSNWKRLVLPPDPKPGDDDDHEQLYFVNKHNPNVTIKVIGDQQPYVPTVPPTTNNVSIIRDRGPLKGVWYINPYLTTESILPPSQVHSRKNLHLEAKSGGIDAEVHLVASRKSKPPAGTTCEIDIISTNTEKGDSVVKLYFDPKRQYPCSMTIEASGGSIFLYIPRTLRGNVDITSKNSPIISKGLSEHFTTLTESGNTWNCFIGGLSACKESEDGDAVTIKAEAGNVYMQYVDEVLKKPIGFKGGCVIM